MSALPLKQHSNTDALVLGSGPEMQRVSKLLELLPSKPRTPVLILGESGTGKRHVARALHLATNPSGELIVLECSRALTQLARLFGNGEPLAGAGTTLYIHEITELPGEVQTRLLQLFEDMTCGPNAMRLVASSSRDLVQAARAGFLRHELAYRFPVLLQLPPLRARAEDIPGLVAEFARAVARRFGGSTVTFSTAAIERLTQYDWPGNVGELYNLVERCALFSDRTLIDLEDLPELSCQQSGIDFRLPPTGISLSDLEREVLVQALRITANNQTHAAALLGLTRDQMRYRMAKFGIATRDSSVPPPPPSSEPLNPRCGKEALNSNG
ncbi:MAG TPA: sigma 54-interacting transcriptional regulator [Polyangiaceae bacterium]|nr:sigma 54-interacting transcriptional regulator [Polyangiaceae bacterium]